MAHNHKTTIMERVLLEDRIEAELDRFDSWEAVEDINNLIYKDRSQVPPED